MISATYAEAAYFDGNHCQHVAAWLEHLRLRRAWQQAQQASRSRRGML